MQRKVHRARWARKASARHPIGARPYKLVGAGIPGVEPGWSRPSRGTGARPPPVFRSLPDEATRRGREVDLALLLTGQAAQDVKRTAGPAAGGAGTGPCSGSTFPDQCDPKSPWADRRVRRPPASLIDRRALNVAEPWVCPPVGTTSDAPSSSRSGRPPPFNPARAKSYWPSRAIRTASTPDELSPFPPYNAMGEAIQGWLRRSASARGCARRRRRVHDRAGARRSSRRVLTSAGSPATRPPGSKSSSRKRRASPTARCPEVDDLFRTRPGNSTARSRGTAAPDPGDPPRSSCAGPDLPPRFSHRGRAARGRHHGHGHPRLLHVAHEKVQAAAAAMKVAGLETYLLSAPLPLGAHVDSTHRAGERGHRQARRPTPVWSGWARPTGPSSSSPAPTGCGP